MPYPRWLRHAPVWVAAAVVLLGATGIADARPAPPTPRVSLSVPGGVVPSGGRVRATGKVTPPQGRIVLQLRRGSAWRSVGSAAVRAGGGFRIAFLAPKPPASEYRLRAILVKGGKAIGRSPVRRLLIEGSAAETAPSLSDASRATLVPAAGGETPSGGTGPAAEAPPSEPSEEPKAPGEEPAPGQEPEPPPDAYWGAWIGSQLTGSAAPWDMGAVTKFEGMAGKAPSLIEFSSPFQECSNSVCTFDSFPTTPFNSIRAYGAIPFFSWGSESSAGGATKEEFQLADIISGTYDSYIREFAIKAREWGHPFFLRFDWEMNGNWFTWGEGTNGNQPGEFVTAWRHVHDIFTSVGATNASWVWCPYVNHLNLYASLYPGDAYVDWTCLDGYNWGTNPANDYGWKTFDELYGDAYTKVVDQIAPSKPMVVGEVASSEWGGSKAQWIEEMVEALAVRYPQIRGLIWFETVSNNMDWPLESSESALAAFAAEIADDRFRPNEFGALEASPIPPP
jgi:hypothetical protein